MKHYNNLIAMLEEQEDVNKSQWTNEQIKYHTVTESTGEIKVVLESESISFHFDKDGKFIGICNYKW